MRWVTFLLLFVLSLSFAFGDNTKATQLLIKSCSGWRLNGLPLLKQVLKNEIGIYENIQIEWIGGHTPTAFFKNSEGQILSQVEIGNQNLAGFLQLLKEHNFEPLLKQALYPTETNATAEFGGHYYEVFDVKNFFIISEKFAQTRIHDGKNGYLLTITSPEENSFVSDLLKQHNIGQAWLGAQDSEVEGQWKWGSSGADLKGPEDGQILFQKQKLVVGENDEVKEQADQGPYTNWRDGEPNDADSDEDCAVIVASDGGWNDVRCGFVDAALVVEFGSTPIQIPAHSSESPRASTHEEL